MVVGMVSGTRLLPRGSGVVSAGGDWGALLPGVVPTEEIGHGMVTVLPQQAGCHGGAPPARTVHDDVLLPTELLVSTGQLGQRDVSRAGDRAQLPFTRSAHDHHGDAVGGQVPFAGCIGEACAGGGRT